ncbi:MAG TPA: DUF4386 domain-containing protein [Acidobacteriaceae bacterium]|jgi:hypothetical protein
MTPLSKNARAAGLLYILFSGFGVVRLIYIPNALIVNGNAAATANNIAAHEWLFRCGIVSQLLCAAGWIFVTLALYRLFKGVDQGLAVLMVILGSLMPVPIFFINAVNDAAALMFSRGGDLLTAFDKPQRDAFAMLFLHLHHQGDLVNIIFWGLWLLPFGVLVYRSRFLPRILGVWLMAGCFGYLAISVTGLLFPQFEGKVYTYAQPLITGEVAIMLWLAIMGAKERHLVASS